MYKEDQDNFFVEMKKIIDLDKTNNSFVINNDEHKVNEQVEKIIKNVKKYYDNSLSKGIEERGTKALLAIVRKICNHHGYNLLKKEEKNHSGRWFRYYIVIK
jgi:hypothetical protein